jgi:hypothetical protein
MITIELSQEGYGKITGKVSEIEDLACEGLLNPQKAVEFCRKIRTQVYSLNSILRETCLITTNANDAGEAAALPVA